ncbi:MAG: MFS transporter [Kiritimatiellae bacterium]|nr:MFS transporter [Kiritimatiellia bacterium]
MKRFVHSVLPAFMLAVSVGQIYAFTNFSDGIASYISTAGNPVTKAQVQFAFSLGIFFLGTGAAFFGKIVEKNIRLSTLIGTTLFVAGMLTTGLGINLRSISLIYLGYGFLVGTGTGIIYISPVKTMMLWFYEHKAIAAALPIISFGLGSTLSTILFKGISWGVPGESVASFALRGFETYGITRVFAVFAVFYAVPMYIASFLLKKPKVEQQSFGHGIPELEFRYRTLFKDSYFLRSWLFMFLNISCGLCLIPLAKQYMAKPEVGYTEGLITLVIALSGLMNGGGRFLFAWWSDRLARRIDILLIILAISTGIMAMSFVPAVIGIALLVINACYGAGFSVIPAILADNYGMTNISKIHGAVLSAWGFAGLAGNQAAILVSDRLGFGYVGVVAMLVVFYSLNFMNAVSLKKATKKQM